MALLALPMMLALRHQRANEHCFSAVLDGFPAAKAAPGTCAGPERPVIALGAHVPAAVLSLPRPEVSALSDLGTSSSGMN